MATDLERLVVQLSADVKGYQNALNRAQGMTNRQAKAIESRFVKMNSNISSSFKNTLTSSVAAVGGALGVAEITRYADAWTEAGNKIRAAATSAGVQARSLTQLKDGANEARTAFGDYVDLYARLIRSASGVAKSEQEIATATDIVSKAFKAGGASAQEQAAGILQLGQALGSGVLQGDELRSLRENAPILAQAIAKEFKTTIAGLKQLGAEGKLTSDRVFKAILNAQKPIEAQFAATNSTIADSFTRLNNEFTAYIGNADKSVGASATLVFALNQLAGNISIVADAAIVLAGVFATRLAGGAIGAAITSVYGLTTAYTAQRIATLSTAQAELQANIAKQASAATNLRMAQTAFSAAQANTALGLSVKAAGAQVVAAQLAMARANAAVTTSTAATSAAISGMGFTATATAGAMRILSGALALVGGPVGAAILAAAAVYSFSSSLSEAEEAAKLHGAAVQELAYQIETLDYANGVAVASTRNKIASDLEAAKVALTRASAERELAAAIAQENINPSMSLLPAPAASDVANTVENDPAVKDRQALIDQINTQIGDLTKAQSTFEDYASGKKRPERQTAGFGGGVDLGEGSGKKGKKPKQNEYQREIEQIQKRTAALQAETLAQSAINPLINDYGYAMEYAAAKHDLLTAAQEAGLAITPELEANIDKLAISYGNAVVESERLAESQDRLRQAADDFKTSAKDITSGFISDIRGGASAAEALSNALGKVLDKVIDIGLNSIFGLGGGGGGGGLFGGLLKVFGLKDGGLVHAATGGRIQGPGTGRSDSIPAMLSNGEFVVNAAATKKYAGLLEAINGGKAIKLANGGYANPSAPTLPSMNKSSFGSSSKDVVTVVLQDDSGRMASIADQRIQTASGTIVKVAVTQANKSAPAAMAQYQQKTAGGDYRN